MSDDKKTEKKGFFSRIFGGLTGSSESDVKEKTSVELPSPSAIKAMKKADIVSTAKEHGLELDITNTKAQLLESWENHFSNDDSPSAVDDAAEAMAESAAKTSESIEEVHEEAAPEEEAPAEEAAPEEEAPVEEAPVEEAASEEEAPVEEAPVEEAAPEEEAPAEEAPAEEAAPEEEAPVEEAPAEEAAPEEEAPVEEAPAEEAAPVISDVEKSPASIVSDFEKSQLKEDLPSFRPGDTVSVSVKVKDGQRTRLQAFEGVVMSVRNSGLNSSFIVRKISSGIGVERTFQLHSPLIDSITVKRKGDVRKAKLFYLRERSGKSARIKERLD